MTTIQEFRCEVDEEVQDEDSAIKKIGEHFWSHYETLAGAVIDGREIVTLGLYPMILRRVIGDMLSLLAYGCEIPSRRKRISVDVEKTVDLWLPLIKALAVAHDVDEKDAASSQLDELLLPIIAAPVAQIREFYRMLTAKMKADKTVPWAVWRLFEFWGENVLDKITKEGELQLKKELAAKIAERSMETVPREDWINSMIGALQWRSPERLKEIQAGLEAGHKPRVRGKESCLFLEVGQAEVML